MNETNSSDESVVAVERKSPEVVFGLLGDDIRVAILQALGETPDEAVPFAALPRRAGVEDSGQFNYHLGKLRGSFVRRTDDGYELTFAGRQIVGAMYAGTYTTNATVDPIPVEGECPVCGGALLAEYGDETARVDCVDCEDWHDEFPFPPGSLDQFDRAELPRAFDRWMQCTLQGVLGGFCHVCSGRMEGRLVRDDEGDRTIGLPAHAEYECARCGSTAHSSGATPALFHPAVQGFLYDHGFQAGTTPSWQLGDVSLPEATLDSEEPLRLAVRFTHGGESVVALVEADATVSSVERRPADA